MDKRSHETMKCNLDNIGAEVASRQYRQKVVEKI